MRYLYSNELETVFYLAGDRLMGLPMLNSGVFDTNESFEVEETDEIVTVYGYDLYIRDIHNSIKLTLKDGVQHSRWDEEHRAICEECRSEHLDAAYDMARDAELDDMHELAEQELSSGIYGTDSDWD